MKAIFPCLFLLVSTIPSFGSAPYFFSVTAKPGDGIIVLLNRYELDEYDCNLDKFLELNKLAMDDHLMEGREYKIPVMIYAYNGQSIRSTIGISDLEKAKRIANYNRLILNRNLRRSDYESSKILWVPYHELNCPVAEAKPIAIKESPGTSEKPASATLSETVSIFGSEYGNITRKSDKLKGKVYYISAGHGGPDPGAMAKTGGTSICEDEYAYD